MALSKPWQIQKYQIPWASIYYSRSIKPISISYNKFIICDELIGLWNCKSEGGTLSFGVFTEEHNAWEIKKLNVIVKSINSFMYENQKGIRIIRFIRNVISYDSKFHILYLLDKLGNLWWFDIVNDIVNCSPLLKFMTIGSNSNLYIHTALVNNQIVFIPQRQACKHGACIIDIVHGKMIVHDKFEQNPSCRDKFDVIRLNKFEGLHISNYKCAYICFEYVNIYR